MVDTFAPPGVSSADLYNERTILDGLFLGTVAYGVHLSLFIWCMNLLLRKKDKNNLDWFFIIYISFLFTMGNVGNAANIKVGEVIWVDNRNFPGGPSAFYAQGGGPYNNTANIVYIINSWFQDGMLVWRFWMFFVSRNNWYIVIIPALMFLSVVGISLVLIVMLCSPGITLWSTISINLAIPYWSISIALNILITACITSRLLYLRYQSRKFIDRTGSEYLSVTSMLVESAALYSSNGLIFLITYALNSPIQNLALPVLGQTQSIAPLLIILRVVQGSAWSSASATKFATTPSIGGFYSNEVIISSSADPTSLVQHKKYESRSSIKEGNTVFNGF